MRVQETVPDTVFDKADEVELIDLPPDELIERLNEGKVYLPEQAKAAIQNFFRKGNLIALRELSLRRTAERVDDEMQAYRVEQLDRGIAAIRNCPIRPWRSELISSRMARASPTMRRAQSSTRSPSGVKLWKREPRLTSSTPSCSSSCFMPADSVGCVTPQASAARPKCRSRASARRNSSLSINAVEISALRETPILIATNHVHR